MGGQIVQNNDVARLEGRSQLSLDVSFENEPVHRRVNDEGGDQGVTSQAGDEGLCLPMSERARFRCLIRDGAAVGFEVRAGVRPRTSPQTPAANLAVASRRGGRDDCGPAVLAVASG